MATTEEFACAACGEATDHRLVAMTRLHIGRKRKWRCAVCEHRLITVDGDRVTG